MMSSTTRDAALTLSDIHDRQLPAGEVPAQNFTNFGKQDSYYHRVLRVLKELPANHADKSKYVLEQARLRCGDTDPSRTYLRDLTEPALAPAVKI